MIELIFGGIAYGVALVKCYDGDTCTVEFSDSNPIIQRQNIRLNGFDTPEIRGKCQSEKTMAISARDFTYNYILNSSHNVVVSRRDRYGRIVVDVGGLADALVEAGLARYYDGGKREGWCDV